jgi:polyisoprenoid-binding protein YceI
MKKTLLFIALTTFVSAISFSQTKMSADTSKTTLAWLGEKVTGQHTGTIKLQSGWISFIDNKIVSGEFAIDMNTIKESTGNSRLEGHLKSDDFFSAAKFPTASLVITGSDSFEKGTAQVRGTLTIKGITNPIEFRSNLQKKDDGLWFYSNIIVDRSKYNIKYGSSSFFDNLGDKVIYDEFKLKVALFLK